MLSSIRRLWAGGEPAHAGESLRQWARENGAIFKAVREAPGFVVEWRSEDGPVRMEWGDSARRYIRGDELRLRAEATAPADVQLLLIERQLMASLEADLFASATGSVQTRLDDTMPEEMRWLVMLPALPLPEPAQARLGAVSNAAPWMEAWLCPELLAALASQAAGQPFLLMVNRARLTLRTAMPLPLPAELTRLRALFELALARMPAATIAWHAAEADGQGDSEL